MDMDGSNGGSNSPAPFLIKTYEMIDDPLTNSVVSWSHTGHSFVVWNPPEFARDLLPKYFKHSNFSSFIRQLNTYGFRKVDPDQWEFANEEFIRGQRYLLKNIHRRKPVHSHSGHGNAVPLTDSEREEFEKEIEKLTQEKDSLHTEVERYKHENQRYKHELQSLGHTLQSVDQRQRQLVTNLTRLLRKQSESPSKKRRLLALHYLQDEANLMEKPYTNSEENLSSSLSLPLLNSEVVEKLDSSLSFWERFLHGIDHIPSKTLPEDSDFNIPPCTPDCVVTGAPSQECKSSPELDISSTYVDDLEISSICIDIESKHKSSGVDVNTSPTKTQETKSADDQEQIVAFPSVRVGGNDVFWQQFFTEAPASSMTQEVQSERRELDDRNDSSEFGDSGKPWWFMDNLAQHMGHLTRVENT